MSAAKMIGAIAVAALLCVSVTAQAATITPLNRDPAGFGLNDLTAATPIGSNPGLTVGDQRKIVYRFAADLWGAVLKSNVEIRVAASFQALPCTSTSGTLGFAGPWLVNRDFPNAPVPDIWYTAAQANSLAGVNLNAGPTYIAPNDIEITSSFNANLGTPGCLDTFTWYYGLDGKTPAGQINFLNVVMHEIGHGLGVIGFVNPFTGMLVNLDGAERSDAYTDRAFDNVSGLRFAAPGMTDETRAIAIRTPGRTVFDGRRVSSEAKLVLDDKTLLNTSGTLAASYDFGTASFGPAANTANFIGRVALADDQAGADPNDACEPLPAGSLTGRIALINRGICGFEAKTVNAEAAGAVGVIIGNIASSAPGLIIMADDPTLSATIPAIQLVFADANAIRNALPGVNTALGIVAGRLQGADAAGRAQLFTPSTITPGSTFSHFDSTLTPNALMEPNINNDLMSQYNVDLTTALFRDIGWRVDQGGAKIGRCTTNVPVTRVGGIIIGANVSAQRNVCLLGNERNPSKYLQCMIRYSNQLRADKVLNINESVSVSNCAVTDTVDMILRQRKQAARP